MDTPVSFADLETKAGNLASSHERGLANDALVTHADMLRAFEEFKSANDENDGAKRADVLLEEKVARINAALDTQARRLDDIALKSARPAFGRDNKAEKSARQIEHKAAFEAYVRAGESAGLRALETKALSAGSSQDGGYLVPAEVESQIGQRLAAISPIRSIASVRTISAGTYKKPFMKTGPAVGWVGETDTRAQTTSPVLDELSFPAMELYAMPAATATLLEDSAVNIDEWIAAEVEQAFATQEGTAFVTGDGSNKPTGFLHYDTVAEASWVWGKLGFVLTGVDGAFPAAADGPTDPLIDLVYALKAGYRQNASFVMNRKTQAAVRKLKDEDGQYLWAPPALAGGRASLMTFPVIEAEDMPNMAADSVSIAFGDFRSGYLVVDRAGVTVLRDPYSAKPYVLFYTTKRVGGGVQDFDAIKLLKFSDA
jgi:HK97 family phage major capsid protein